MSQQSSDALSAGQIEQLLAAGWWTSGEDRWFGPEQHPDPAHRSRFAPISAPDSPVQQPAPIPNAPAAFAPPTQQRMAAPAVATPNVDPVFPPIETPSFAPAVDSVVAETHQQQQFVDPVVAETRQQQQFGDPTATPETIAYVEPESVAAVDPAHASTPAVAPAAPPPLSPLAQQMAEEARRKALPPVEPEPTTEVPDEEWRRVAAANAAAMEANMPGRTERRGSGKRAQRRNWLPVSALLFAIAGLVAFAYYVPSVRTTLIETKAQITGEQVPVTVRPAPGAVPNESGMSASSEFSISD